MKSSLSFIFLCLLFLTVHLAAGALNPDVHLTDQDRLRIRDLFSLDQKLDSTCLPTLHYSLIGLNIPYNSNLNAAFESTQKKAQLCDQLKSFIGQKGNQNLDNLYFASSSLKLLNCQVSGDSCLNLDS